MANEDRKSEVARLLNLAREKSRAGRASLFSAISDLFERRDSELTAEERALMLEILRHLCQEVEVAVRTRLAERLAGSGQATRDLLTMLANDEVAVAQEVLLRSPVLRDADLVEVVRHRTMQHRLAIATRKGTGETVTTALVEAGEEDVIATLLENHEARLKPAVMEYLVDESKRVDRYQAPLVRRSDLPPALAKRMVAWVSAALRQQLVNRYDVDQEAVDDALSGIVKDAFEKPESEEATAAQRVVDKLHAAGELSQGFALKSLRQGQVPLFEAAMAEADRPAASDHAADDLWTRWRRAGHCLPGDRLRPRGVPDDLSFHPRRPAARREVGRRGGAQAGHLLRWPRPGGLAGRAAAMAPRPQLLASPSLDYSWRGPYRCGGCSIAH